MKIQHLFLYIAFLSTLGLFASGCAGVKKPSDGIQTQPEPERQGIYHKVGPGQTIWRIAKTYDVSIQDIIQTNNIPNVAQIEVDQLIFIPGAFAVKDVVVDDKAENDKDFIWPVKGKIVRYFSEKTDDLVSKGIDLEVPEGEIVKAARSGKVVFSDYLTGYGPTVILEHGDGFHSVYSHNGKLLVSLNQNISRADPIAQVGRQGDGSYLHFEIRKNSVEDNPLYYLPKL